MTGGRLVAAADAGVQALSPDPAGSARYVLANRRA